MSKVQFNIEDVKKVVREAISSKVDDEGVSYACSSCGADMDSRRDYIGDSDGEAQFACPKCGDENTGHGDEMVRAESIQLSPDELRNMLAEQLGGFSSTDEAQLEISLELCKAYCRMMAESFDKGARNASKPDDVLLQFEIVSRHMKSLTDEMGRAEKSAKRLAKK